MDVFSHALWAGLIIKGDPAMIVAGSVAPDILDGINWGWRLVSGRGTFWKNKKDLAGLVLGIEEYADGYKHVNRGLLYKGSLLINSIWWVGMVFLLGRRDFALAYGLHVLADIFTHKDSEIGQPFYPFSGLELKLDVVRWRLDLSWFVIGNFVLLAVLYLIRFGVLR